MTNNELKNEIKNKMNMYMVMELDGHTEYLLGQPDKEKIIIFRDDVSQENQENIFHSIENNTIISSKLTELAKQLEIDFNNKKDCIAKGHISCKELNLDMVTA